MLTFTRLCTRLWCCISGVGWDGATITLIRPCAKLWCCARDDLITVSWFKLGWVGAFCSNLLGAVRSNKIAWTLHFATVCQDSVWTVSANKSAGTVHFEPIFKDSVRRRRWSYQWCCRCSWWWWWWSWSWSRRTLPEAAQMMGVDRESYIYYRLFKKILCNYTP